MGSDAVVRTIDLHPEGSMRELVQTVQSLHVLPVHFPLGTPVSAPVNTDFSSIFFFAFLSSILSSFQIYAATCKNRKHRRHYLVVCLVCPVVQNGSSVEENVEALYTVYIKGSF